jgi:Na+-transporting methylmalonyl-CoA/oxaloacetate decarboxylase gamma subunit
MAIDWSFAGQVGGMGFGMVFALLIILAIVIWLTGLILNKTTPKKHVTDEKQKGA